MVNESLIPIKDESSLAFNELFDRLGTLDLTPLLIYLIDNVEASVLPHLAEQFHVTGNEGWKLSSTQEKQRELIKESVKIHKIKGTKAAVKNVLKVLNLEGTIQEWFEYEGDPFHFRVSVLLKNSSYDTKNLINMIDEYKNVRSKLEELNIEAKFNCSPNWLTYLNAENEVSIL